VFVEKEDYKRFRRTSKTFDTLVVGSWEWRTLFENVYYNIGKERVMMKCICMYVGI
jgi:hypothetical protein